MGSDRTYAGCIASRTVPLTRQGRRAAAWLVLFVASVSIGIAQVNAAQEQQYWAATWTASPQEPFSFGPAPLPGPFKAQTVRQIARISLGGERIRVRFSNEIGTQPLVIGSATVALPAEEGKVKKESVRPITFGGQRTITIPAGAPALSDPIDFRVSPLDTVAVSMYLPAETAVTTVHAASLQDSYLSGEGDFTAAANFEVAGTLEMRPFLSGIEVLAPMPPRVIVAFGDSITDGVGSKSGANQRWPDLLAARLLTGAGAKQALAVVNHGISGNQLLRDGVGQSALRRFDRDVLGVSGATHVVVLIGINDIGMGGFKIGDRYMVSPAEAAGADDMILAYRQLIARAQAAGLKIIGATLTPFVGANVGYYTPEKEIQRKAVNEWIRSSGEFHAVIDFDAATRDPANPGQLLAEYDSGDHLHPSDAGYRKMAESIDLKIFD